MNLILAALTPFLLLFILMAVLKKPAVVAAPVTLVITLLITIFVWSMEANWILASLLRGGLVSLDILWIIFGAMVLLFVMQAAGFMDSIEVALTKITTDKRIQAILIGWFFVSFIEGAAGFGAPAMLAAPLLVVLGFSPLTAVVIALVGDSVAVTFGAVGVPITIGIAEGVNMSEIGITNLPRQVAVMSSLIYLFIGSLIPLSISVLSTYMTEKSIKKGFAVWPFAIFAGFLFLIPSYLSAVFLPLEFPSMVGGLVGGILAVLVVKSGFLQPKIQWTPFVKKTYSKATKKIGWAFLPYIVILILLAFSRLDIAGTKTFLLSFNWQIFNILGTEASYSLPILYSPGFIFLLIAFITAIASRLSFVKFSNILGSSVKRLSLPFITLLAVLGIVQLFIFSGNNTSGLHSMPLLLAESLAVVGPIWPLLAPLIGAMGAFIAGSSTVSNLLFSSFQAQTALLQGLGVVLILSLQAVGSAVGNMIAIHNIIAAQAAVGLKHKEGKILRLTLIPAMILIITAGLIGLIFKIY